jgi:hypothetical protein
MGIMNTPCVLASRGPPETERLRTAPTTTRLDLRVSSLVLVSVAFAVYSVVMKLSFELAWDAVPQICVGSPAAT